MSVNLITCAGTLDSTMLESHALLMPDDEICGMAVRMARGIDVNEETLLLDLIKKVGYSSNYITVKETSKLYRKELFIPTMFSSEPYETWEKEGRKLTLSSQFQSMVPKMTINAQVYSSARRINASWSLI